MANVLNKQTLQYLESVNTPEYLNNNWIINPDSNIIKNVPKKYWKIENDELFEMSESEKNIVDMNDNSQDITNKINKLWEDYNNYANSQMDVNSRHSINLMTVDVNTTSEQMNRILEYGEWWKNLWLQFNYDKQQILSGSNIQFDESNMIPCPYNIWEISQI